MERDNSAFVVFVFQASVDNKIPGQVCRYQLHFSDVEEEIVQGFQFFFSFCLN